MSFRNAQEGGELCNGKKASTFISAVLSQTTGTEEASNSSTKHMRTKEDVSMETNDRFSNHETDT